MGCAAQSATKSTFLAAAIRKCGGNEEKGGLLYNAYGSNGQVCYSFYPVQLLFRLDRLVNYACNKGILEPSLGHTLAYF